MVSSITVPGNRCSKGVSLLWRTRPQGSLHCQHWTFQQFECCVQHASEERTFSTCVSVNSLNQSVNVYIRSSFLTSSCMWLCVNIDRGRMIKKEHNTHGFVNQCYKKDKYTCYFMISWTTFLFILCNEICEKIFGCF